MNKHFILIYFKLSPIDKYIYIYNKFKYLFLLYFILLPVLKNTLPHNLISLYHISHQLLINKNAKQLHIPRFPFL